MLGVLHQSRPAPRQPEPTPRDWGDRTSNRADEYNPPTDKYARVIVEELMPALKKDYNLSRSGSARYHGREFRRVRRLCRGVV